MNFESYTLCVFRAFLSHFKSVEIVKRKQEIISNVASFHNFIPDSILYVGFNPAIIDDRTKNIFVTLVDKEVCDYLDKNNIKYNYVPYEKLDDYSKQFDVVVAMDEFFTFAHSDTEQKDLVYKFCNLAKEFIITTCKDYKNQEFKDREFSTPALVRTKNSNNIYLEFHDHDINDRNSWKTEVYEIVNNQLTHIGPFHRKAMFFKQLAKFCTDSGSIGFSVHKNLMYKSLIKKNYEHVISIRFDNYGP